MLGLLSIVVSLGGVFVYLQLGWWALQPHPWPLYAIEAVAAALGAWALFRSAGRWRWAGRIAGLGGMLLVFGCYLGLWVATNYGSARPTGPAVGEPFPIVALRDAASGTPIDLRGSTHFVVLFRGFW